MKTGDNHFLDEESAKEFLLARSLKEIPKDLDWDLKGYNAVQWGTHGFTKETVEFMVTDEQADALKGTLVSFNAPKIQEIEKRSRKKLQKVEKNYAIRSSALSVVAGTVWGWNWIPAIYLVDGFMSAALWWIALVFAAGLLVFLVNGGVSTIEYQMVKKKWMEEIEIPAETQLFYFGRGSLALELIKRSKELMELVKQKVLTSPTGEELHLWCQNVEELLVWDESFPFDMIPDVSTDVKILCDRITARKKELWNWDDERKALYSGMTEESNVAMIEDTKDLSEAKLEGALTYINLMGPGIMKPVEDES